jgi:DNA-binding CsgD family transcriptional regulator
VSRHKQEWLTPRNIEVLRLRCDGKTKVETGMILGITKHGVRYHIQKIYEITKVNSNALLIRWALKNKIISLETD